MGAFQYPILGSWVCIRRSSASCRLRRPPFSILSSDRGCASRKRPATGNVFHSFSILSSDRGCASCDGRSVHRSGDRLSVSYPRIVGVHQILDYARRHGMPAFSILSSDRGCASDRRTQDVLLRLILSVSYPRIVGVHPPPSPPEKKLVLPFGGLLMLPRGFQRRFLGGDCRVCGC